MWRHLYGLENDDAHDYEVDYCAARSFAETTDKEKLKVARVVRDGKTGILKGPFCQVFLSFPQTKEIPELMEQKDPPKCRFGSFVCLRTRTPPPSSFRRIILDGEHDNENHDNTPAVTT